MEKEIKYAKGKNPNSLANLKKGRTFRDKEFARACVQRSNEVQKAKRTMRELANSIGQEEQTFPVRKQDGTLEYVTMTRLEMIVRNFFKECVSNPNHKNVLALQKLRGEDEHHLTVEGSVQAKYDGVQVTAEMIARAEAIMSAKTE